MMDLIRELPQDREEKLKTAEIMWNGSGFMKKDSAKLFRELGEEGRYIQYLETHLSDEPEQYMEAMSRSSTWKWFVFMRKATRANRSRLQNWPGKSAGVHIERT